MSAIFAELETQVPQSLIEHAEFVHGYEANDPEKLTQAQRLGEDATDIISQNFGDALESVADLPLPEVVDQARRALEEVYEVFNVQTAQSSYVEKQIKLAKGEPVSIHPADAGRYKTEERDPLRPINLAEASGHTDAAPEAVVGMERTLASWARNPEKKARLDAQREFMSDRPYDRQVGRELAMQIAKRRKKDREQTGHLSLSEFLSITKKDSVTPFAVAQGKASKVAAMREETIAAD